MHSMKAGNCGQVCAMQMAMHELWEPLDGVRKQKNRKTYSTEWSSMKPIQKVGEVRTTMQSEKWERRGEIRSRDKTHDLFCVSAPFSNKHTTLTWKGRRSQTWSNFHSNIRENRYRKARKTNSKRANIDRKWDMLHKQVKDNGGAKFTSETMKTDERRLGAKK